MHYGPQWAILKFDQPVTAPHVSAPVLATTFASIYAYTSNLPILSAVNILLECSAWAMSYW